MPIVSNPLGIPYAITSGSYGNNYNVTQTFGGQLVGLPRAIGGVITLEDNTSYNILGTINLGTNRIVFGDNSKLYSTGVGKIITNVSGSALITCDYQGVISGVDFEAENLNQSTFIDANPQDIVQGNLIISDCTIKRFNVIGSISNYNLLLIRFVKIEDQNQGLLLSGQFGNAAFIDCAITVADGNYFVSANSSIDVKSSISFIECIISDQSASFGVIISANGIIPNEGFRVINCEFEGGGTPISGIVQDDNRAYFKGNINLRSTYPSGLLSFNGNILSTTFAGSGVWTKINATTAQIDAERFTHSNNRFTYTGAKTRKFSFQFLLSFTGSTNNDYEFSVSKNGSPLTAMSVEETVDVIGRVNNMTGIGLVELQTNDFIEVWVRNNSTSDPMTAEKGKLKISEIS